MAARPPTILVVDDQENMRNIVIRVLALEGYEYEVASNGKRALEILETRPIALALLDISMPIVDGIGVVEQMKGSAAMRDIPVIMVTGHVDTRSVMRCKELGVDDYLVKPYKISALLQRIEAALQRSEE